MHLKLIIHHVVVRKRYNEAIKKVFTCVHIFINDILLDFCRQCNLYGIYFLSNDRLKATTVNGALKCAWLYRQFISEMTLRCKNITMFVPMFVHVLCFNNRCNSINKISTSTYCSF